MRRGLFSLSDLPAWCVLNDVSFIDVKVANISGKGYGLVAEKDLVNGDDNSESPILLTVPKELVLCAEAVEEYAKESKNFRQLLDAAGHQVSTHYLHIKMAQLLLNTPIYSPLDAMSYCSSWYSSYYLHLTMKVARARRRHGLSIHASYLKRYQRLLCGATRSFLS